MISYRDTHGFTLIELIIVIALIGILSGLVLGVFTNNERSLGLSKNVESALSLLEDARSRSVYSYPDSSFGVRIASTTMTLFAGDVYNPAGIVKSIGFDSGIEVSRYTIDGGGTDIIYGAVSGTSSPADITLMQKSNSASSTIHVYASGLTTIK